MSALRRFTSNPNSNSRLSCTMRNEVFTWMHWHLRIILIVILVSTLRIYRTYGFNASEGTCHFPLELGSEIILPLRGT
ncbi:hypothetical protein RSAG8_11548, partial [Rhizoctonia solani AG-8 WAC10335]